jgi:formylglycine-generating enzyme required for sulfatase activity
MELYRSEALSEYVALTMRSIPGGSFLMGSPENEPDRVSNEGPQHLVKLEPFEMSVTTITQAQWAVVAEWPAVNRTLAQDPSRFKGLNRPVDSINWYQALEFCARLNEYTGRDYTLPSEAQWEYACRAGTTTPFAFGETLTPELANYDENSTYGSVPKDSNKEETTDAGTFRANAWGLHDMHGNVWEWCADHWHANYEGAPEDGRPWLEENVNEDERRVQRGGSWNRDPRSCRSAYRFRNRPDNRYYDWGFRVCCLPEKLKPKNANQQLTDLALTTLDTIERSGVFIPEITGIIRKAVLLNT